MGTLVVGRGEVWWGETPDDKGRPYLVVSRDAANATMRRVLVATGIDLVIVAELLGHAPSLETTRGYTRPKAAPKRSTCIVDR